ncbi:MAG: UDP-N-acetylglucosamine 2-epimerase [Deltaproteobacteria bacterium RBG_16_49_23]|nr:MAG: UDP-N-acetylglucosamine 2-epimerase [Deltaproteobacteria bacterium RBG_16_49_23]
MKILFFFGTRPEAIKVAPLIKELQKFPDTFEVKVCVSAQHREMLDQVLTFFDIVPNVDLGLMRPNQDLYGITTRGLQGIGKVLKAYRPDWLIVQGDTTTTFVGALAAFYEKISVAHVEAGLRSFHPYAPFPEEVNRVLTTHLSTLHFAPTLKAKENLLKESIPKDKIFVVGNTSIDALFLCLKKVSKKKPSEFESFQSIRFEKKIILVTGHRRESFGKPFENICLALKEIAQKEEVEIVYPVHLNPNVRKPVFDILKSISNIHLIEPLDYPSFVWLMNRSYLILTDSGGVQEEAPSLGKPVLVMRDVTERTEGIDAGTAKVVGTDREMIVRETLRLLRDEKVYRRMARAVHPVRNSSRCDSKPSGALNPTGMILKSKPAAEQRSIFSNGVNPYGDGKASGRIASILQAEKLLTVS